MTPIFGPRRSSSVLVPTVVPCTIEPSGDAAERAQAVEETCASSPRRDGTFAVVKRARRRIEAEQVGERAADVDPDDHGSCARHAVVEPS